jgi:SAM-dependent methyltransferase
MATDRRPWYEDLFESGDYARFWLGSGMLTPERTAREVAFLVEALGLRPGSHILDLCCGQGRHAIALAQRGYRVTGIDLSQRLLEMAREAAGEAGAEIEWVHADMRAIPARFEGKLDAVINMFTAFGYLESDAEDQQVLGGIGRSLRPGGLFFLDFINRESVVRTYRPSSWEEVGGALVLHENNFDLASGRNSDVMRVIEADGSRHETGHSVRMYTLVELKAMLDMAGLSMARCWGGFDGSDLTLDSRRLIVLAEKR